MEIYMKNKICLINVKYSDNLGDGLISEHMESELNYLSLDHIHIDLSGKTHYKRNIEVQKNSVKSKFLDWLNSYKELAKYLLFLPNYFAGKRLVKKVSEPEKITHIIIGGGALFSDTGAYFPARLIAVCQYLKKKNPNVYIATYGIGVSEHLSKFGVSLFSYLINKINISQFLVRDLTSQNYVKTLFNVSADIVLDPALMTTCKPFQDQNTPAHIAIGIMSPAVLKRCGTNYYQRYDKHFYIDLFMAYQSLGYSCTFFTNGAYSDEVFLQEIKQAMGDEYSHCFQERFETPNALVEFIETKSLILSHRLHANIIAFSKAVPSIGFPWDAKVVSFFTLSQRSTFFIDCNQSTTDFILEKSHLAMKTPVNNSEFLVTAKQQFLNVLQAESI
jgi:polysaccharide pyruvyl transferase WcaK-like protein